MPTKPPNRSVRVCVATGNEQQWVVLPLGQSYRDALRHAGLPLIGECDSAMICATCHMILDQAWGKALQPRSDEEQDLLETLKDYGFGSRLSCQTLVEEGHEGLTLRLPNSSMAL